MNSKSKNINNKNKSNKQMKIAEINLINGKKEKMIFSNKNKQNKMPYNNNCINGNINDINNINTISTNANSYNNTIAGQSKKI